MILNFNKKHNIFKVDIILYIIFILMVLSLISIYSAGNSSGNSLKYIYVQLIAFFIGFICIFIFSKINYRYYEHSYKLIYILSLIILISVLVFGSTKRGTKGWFDFGFISFQPVEIAKIMFILSFSSFIDLNEKKIKKIYFFIFSFVMFFIHLILIMMQPDFSSTLSYFPVVLILFFLIGVKTFYILCSIIFLFFLISISIFKTIIRNMLTLEVFQEKIITIFTNVLFFFKTGYKIFYFIIILLFLIIFCLMFLKKINIKIKWFCIFCLFCSILTGCIGSIFIEKYLKDYQRKRLIVFLNPKIDSKGAGYNIIQSKITIGSGKILGKGFMNGSQTQLGFLPERHTDFIFSTICEEFGWVISQLIIVLYFILICKAFAIAKKSHDRYGYLVAIGIATMFCFYVIINVGMVTGVMPITGVPLLFLSYGGSSVFSSLCAVGILYSIDINNRYYL
jgi:rod shape determining protein RodA